MSLLRDMEAGHLKVNTVFVGRRLDGDYEIGDKESDWYWGRDCVSVRHGFWGKGHPTFNAFHWESLTGIRLEPGGVTKVVITKTEKGFRFERDYA